MYCEKPSEVLEKQEEYKALWEKGSYGRKYKEEDIAFLLALPAILPMEKYKTVDGVSGVGITPDGLFRLTEHIDVYWDLDRACEALKQHTQKCVNLIKQRREWARLLNTKDIYDD